MKTTYQDVEKALEDIQEFMRKVETKDPSLTTRKLEQSPIGLGYQLMKCSSAFLHHPEAFDLFAAAAPKIEAHRGKGTQHLIDALPRTLQAIICEARYGPTLSNESQAGYSKENLTLISEKIAIFALPRAKGDGKKVRSQRAARLRETYWEILTDLAEEQPFPEALALAKTIALDKKSSQPERCGAINYLLTELDQEDTPPDPEISSILEKLRNQPPSRTILIQILDNSVQSGEISEIGALMELEDWDEMNQ